MPEYQSLFEKLEIRRRELGLSQSALADLSGVSLPTVHRILTAQSPAASLENILAIAQTLGMRLDAVPILDAQAILELQARNKAKKLVGLVKGTSALEGQRISEKRIRQMVQKTVQELLSGSRRKLWTE